MTKSSNIDPRTVAGFGEEWAAYDQTSLATEDQENWFGSYFGIFPWDRLPAAAQGFDLGCGSGRWAASVAPKVGHLHCIDPAEKALAVARRRLEDRSNVSFHHAAADQIPLPDCSQDFGYSLGVLHHIPDTGRALRDCVAKLKPGAPFLLYLYYALDDRPLWFRAIWRATDLARRGVSAMPFAARKSISEVIAATVYWPLSRGARLAERAGLPLESWPLKAYRNSSYYTLRTDALDRFGTRLEQRFTKTEIAAMMRDAGLGDLGFSDREPFWVACGIKS